MTKKARNILGAVIYTIRPSASLGAVLLVAAAYHPQPGEWGVMIPLLLTAFFGSGYCFLVNDIYDRDKDLLNEKLRPIATGQLPLKIAYGVTILFAILFLVGAFFFGMLIFILALLFLILTTTYSYINIKSGIVANVIVAIIVAGTLWGTWFIKPDPILVPIAFFLFFFTIPREMILDWLDESGDKAFGKTSLAITYSGSRFKWLLALFLIAASISATDYVFIQADNWKVAAMMGLAVLSAWASFFRFFHKTNRKNALFAVRFSHLTFALVIIAMFLR